MKGNEREAKRKQVDENLRKTKRRIRRQRRRRMRWRKELKKGHEKEEISHF